MQTFKNMKLFSGNANRLLAEAIGKALGIPLGECEVKQFSDGETWVEIKENVRGMDVFVIQPTSAPANHHMMELLIMIDAFKRASADRITAVMPYYGYARQERKVQPRTPISAKLVADLLTAAGANRILSMDLHAGQIQGFFNIPFDHLYSMPVLLDAIREVVQTDGVVVAPDAGGAERARAFAKRLGCPLAMIDKRRSAPNVSEVMHLIGDVQGRRAVIVDDIIDTAGTLSQAAAALKKEGATAVFACCAHGVFSGKAAETIMASPLEQVIVTDTIALRREVATCKKVLVRSVAPILAEAIRRIYQSDSVSSLFV
ncbi:MAG: ribose-phosphate pyrophosphokinase [Deltaproteobacteria bacterium]|nr:ribose-phosphate pyrophosphokinase [Deltaproteobacteria bacterium]